MAGIGTSEPPKLGEYDVFLSFRGLDTRKNFTSCLYHDLVGAGIRAFRDDDELLKGKEIGKELLRAIANSRIFMPILSPNFATSAWCLREVAHAVQCRQKSGGRLEIMPIFYNVDVADVKLREGSTYEVHINQHRDRFKEEVLLQWKDALKDVAKIKGWTLNDETDHGELIKSIVLEVLAKLHINYRNLPKMLVGIYQAEAIMQLINADAEGVKFIVIHGMGGIGKTTLAQVVFNWLNTRYDGCSFLGDVRESSNLHGILHLQKKLLSDIINPKFAYDIRDSNDGINQIRTRLCTKKVLIVLDDINHESQLKNLAGSSGWFGFGSRIIITTRDRGVLLMQGEKDKYFHYDVEQMKFDDALRLFSWHSFGKDYPPNDYVDLSKKIVSITASLPLALEVVGSGLFCRCLETCECKGIWEDTLDELRRVPDKNVEETLMISIKRLDDKQRSVFLDIACFLIHNDKTNAIFMWRDCELSPNKVINSLVLMSLIKINDNKFWMHDQLRDLGRAIVHRENRHPGRRSRVWNVQEAMEIIEKKQGTEDIEVLILGSVYCNLTDDESAKLENLRFLKLRGKLEGEFKNLLPNLRWLCWDGYYSADRLTNFCPSNLVVLELHHRVISDDWKGWEPLKMANKLKVLDLTGCSAIKRTPDFSSFILLERLILVRCGNLGEIDPSIGKLGKLTYLSMEGCTDLGELPESIGELANLKHLSFRDCWNFDKLPESIGKLTSLVELDISRTKIESLDFIGDLKSLKFIYLNDSWVTRLPASLGLLKSLEELHACVCFKLKGEIPRSISNLSHLRKLHLLMDSSDDSKMKCLPEFPSSLDTLAIANWMGVAPDLSYLSNLTELDLHISGIQRTELRGICKLSKLKKLRIEHSYATVRGDEFASLIHLEHLRLSCRYLEWPLRLPSGLITLTIENWLRTPPNDGLSLAVSIPCLGELQVLRDLRLEYCNFSDLDGLHLLSNLRSLSISDLSSCRRFPDLSSCGNITQSLQSIFVYRCNSLEALYGLSNLTNLRSLKILDCKGLRVVQGLETLRACLGHSCYINPDHMLNIVTRTNQEIIPFKHVYKRRKKKE